MGVQFFKDPEKRTGKAELGEEKVVKRMVF